MAADHPDQRTLHRYLDSAEAAAAERLTQVNDPLALSLTVGLKPTTPVLHEHDLDNYLWPLASRLAQTGRRIASAWARKLTANDSYLALETASARGGATIPGWTAQVEVTASSQTVAFKEQVRSGLAGLRPLSPGPVMVELSFVVGPSRNWLNLWKPSIDSLGLLLGHAPGAKEWNPLDGRIVELALHCAVDADAGHNVVLGIRALEVDASEPPEDSIVPIPVDSDERKVIQFALSYNAYAVHGTNIPAVVAQSVLASWEGGDGLSPELDVLRTALFWEQRRHRHSEDPRSFSGLPYVAALLAQIRAVAPAGVPRVGPSL